MALSTEQDYDLCGMRQDFTAEAQEEAILVSRHDVCIIIARLGVVSKSR